jgi:hypothetical protein
VNLLKRVRTLINLKGFSVVIIAIVALLVLAVLAKSFIKAAIFIAVVYILRRFFLYFDRGKSD